MRIVNCPADSVEVGPEEEIFDGHNPNAVDVVVIFEDGCLDSPPYDITFNIEEALIQQGFHSKRYAYVAYSSSGTYTVTYRNEVWNDATESEPLGRR